MKRNRLFDALLWVIIILLVILIATVLRSYAGQGREVWGCWDMEKGAWALEPRGPAPHGVYAVYSCEEARTMCDHLDEGTGVYVPALMNAGRPLMVAKQGQGVR